jgi:hypothetical protein
MQMRWERTGHLNFIRARVRERGNALEQGNPTVSRIPMEGVVDS